MIIITLKWLHKFTVFEDYNDYALCQIKPFCQYLFYTLIEPTRWIILKNLNEDRKTKSDNKIVFAIDTNKLLSKSYLQIWSIF